LDAAFQSGYAGSIPVACSAATDWPSGPAFTVGVVLLAGLLLCAVGAGLACTPVEPYRSSEVGLVYLGLVGVVGDAAGDVGVFVEVVAGADAVVAIGDLQGN
jgi:hypothetical protein